MRKLMILPAMLLALGACTDPYGNVDPLATGLLGAGLGAAAGVGIAAASQPPRYRYYDRGYYAPPRAYGYYGPPRYYYGAPRRYYGW